MSTFRVVLITHSVIHASPRREPPSPLLYFIDFFVFDGVLISGKSFRTIQSCEQVFGVPPGRTSTLDPVRKAFESEGIEFIGTPEDLPGFSVRRKANNA